MRASKFQSLLCAKSGHYAVQQFDGVLTAVDAAWTAAYTVLSDFMIGEAYDHRIAA